SFSPLPRLAPRLDSGLSSGMTSPSTMSSTKSSVAWLAFFAGRPGRRPVDLVARTVVAFFAAVFLAAVFLAAVFFAAVFLAAAFFAAGLAEPPAASTSSPTFTESESASRVAAMVLAFWVVSSATSGETRVTFVIVAFRRRNITGMAQGHYSLLQIGRKDALSIGGCAGEHSILQHST